MTRLAAAVGVALCVSQATLHAQAPVFTVQAVSADVYKAPSTGSPIIGHVPRGTTFPVTRELGSWVKVSWPRGEDGVGYVHVSMGSLGRDTTSDKSRPATTARSPQPVAEAASSSASPIRVPAATPQGAPTRVVYLQAPGHLVGFGGRVGPSNVGFGASARAWSRDRFGVQFDVSRAAVAGLAPTERVTSMQFEPGVLYTLADHVADYIWVRPYAGSGLTIGRRSLSSTIPGAAPVASQSNVGVQAFGGTELTFPSVPRFAVSADVAYRWGTMEFAGIDLGRVGVSFAGRWYVK
jgi:SH3 domain-containing protein